MNIYCSIVSNSKRLEVTQIFHQSETDFLLACFYSFKVEGAGRLLFLKPGAELALGISVPLCPALLLSSVSPSKRAEPSQGLGPLEHLSVMRGLDRRGSNAELWLYELAD